MDQGVKALQSELNMARNEIQDLVTAVEKKEQQIHELESENSNLERIRNDVL